MKYRKRPVVIDAIKYDGVAMGSAMDFIDLDHSYSDADDGEASLFIPTLEGEMEAKPGDWIIRGVQGEYYPCKPDIFEATYEEFQQ